MNDTLPLLRLTHLSRPADDAGDLLVIPSRPEAAVSAVQDQIAAMTQQGQDVLSGALRTWAQGAERMTGLAGAAASPSGAMDPVALVETAFDLAEQVLAVQRRVTVAVVRALTSGLPGAGR